MKKFFYRVQSGDNIWEISRKYNLPIGIIIAENNLCEEIYAGQILVIPKPDGCLYEVKPTDTLTSIAKRFNQTEEEILKRNKIDYIFYGMTLLM